MKKNLQNKKAFSLIELSVVILIVGVIIAGVTQSSRLIAAFKLNSARTITQSSPVNSISDLALWLESTSEKSFDASDQDDGQYVDNWYDVNPQTSAKINFNQPGSTAVQPIYRTSSGTINSLPTIKFDGANPNGDNLYNSTTLLSQVAQSDQITIFIVEKVMSSANDNSTFFITPDDGTNRINFHSPEGGFLRWDFGNTGSGTSRISVATPGTFIGNARVVSLIRRPANTGAIRLNGADAVNTTMNSTFSTSALATNMRFDLAIISANTPYAVNAYIGELIIFRRALKSDEITDVERYLGKKWGITIP